MSDQVADRLFKSRIRIDESLMGSAEAFADHGYCVTDMSIDELKKFIMDYVDTVIRPAYLPLDRVNDTNRQFWNMQKWDRESQAYFLAYLSVKLIFLIKKDES